MNVRRAVGWGVFLVAAAVIAAVLVMDRPVPGAPSVPSERPGASLDPSAGDDPEDRAVAVGAPTSPSPDGNRYVLGRGGLGAREPVVHAYAAVPRGLEARPGAEPGFWVTFDDGRVARVDLDPDGAPAFGALLDADGEQDDGRVPDSVARAIDLLPDAVPATDPNGRSLWLTGATDDRYVHGVLGDDVEASSLSLISADGVRAIASLPIEVPRVIEGRQPIWTDADGDGDRDILVTISGPEGGAFLRVYEDIGGEVLGESDDLGTSQRWRHQLAVAPFGPDGELEIAEVTTPHLGRTARFHRLTADGLVEVASHDGVTTHAIGSSNLDQALAGDVDGDGRIELLVTTPDRRTLVSLERTEDGVRRDHEVQLDGRLTTAIVAFGNRGGAMTFALGTDAGTLWVWPAG